jgi:ABC-type uncharacterized transport system substrate-binding protein
MIRPMMSRLAPVAALALAAPLGVASAGVARAHPHIFVDTGVTLIHDEQGRLTALRISWTYDELFSLLMLEDLGLDADYDGVLSEEETETLQGFDMDWPEWYEGDVYLEASGTPVALGPPEPGNSGLLPNGMLTSTHTRRLERPVDGAGESVVVKVYDPTFYTAYSILPEQVSSEAPGCTTAVFTPDLDAAYAYLDAALEELGASIDDPFVEQDFPPVGDRFSEEVRLTCEKAGG